MLDGLTRERAVLIRARRLRDRNVERPFSPEPIAERPRRKKPCTVGPLEEDRMKRALSIGFVDARRQQNAVLRRHAAELEPCFGHRIRECRLVMHRIVVERRLLLVAGASARAEETE